MDTKMRKTLNISLFPEDIEKFDRIARSCGYTRSGLIRFLMLSLIKAVERRDSTCLQIILENLITSTKGE